MTKDEFKNLKIEERVIINNPRNQNYGKIGVVKFIEINDSDTGRVFLEPFNCEFKLGANVTVLYGEKNLYGFYRQVVYYLEDR